MQLEYFAIFSPSDIEKNPSTIHSILITFYSQNIVHYIFDDLFFFFWLVGLQISLYFSHSSDS